MHTTRRSAPTFTLGALLLLVAAPSQALVPPLFVSAWGVTGGGPGQFNGPRGVEVDANGTFWVADASNNRIQHFSAAGGFLGAWGTLGSAPGFLSGPFDIALSANANVVYVADTGNNRIQVFAAGGLFLFGWGGPGSAPGLFQSPTGIDLDAAGNVYVVDNLNHRVQKFTGAGAFITQWGGLGTGNGQFSFPAGVSVRGNGDVFVTDLGNNRVERFTSGGSFLSAFGSFGSGNGQFNAPYGIDVDGYDDVYVADGNARVEVFSAGGTYLTQWGTSGSGNGQFSRAVGVAVNPNACSILVSDDELNRVQKFSYCTGTGSIFGRKYHDQDLSGTENFEPGLPGWQIKLTGLPNGVTVTTNANGDYAFTNLPPGTYTVCEVTQPGWVATAPPGGCTTFSVGLGQSVGPIAFGNFACPPGPSCTRPPYGMRAWWPFDETSGPALDVVGPNDGTLIAGATRVSGEVANALQAPTLFDYARVIPSNGALDFGTGPFSIDAWIKTPIGQAQKTQNIVDKRAGDASASTGYVFYLFDGKLAFQMGTGPYTNWFSNAFVADNQWHHVAVTVKRAVNGGTMWVDGAPVATFNPAIYPGSITNFGPLLMGQRQILPPHPYIGLIDEVELFARELNGAEISAIYSAGSRGKCKSFCYAPSVTSYSAIGGSVVATMQICNGFTSTHSYHWTLAGLPLSSTCTAAAPTTFSPMAGTVTLLAGQCASIPVTIPYPAGLGVGQASCYQFTAYDDVAGTCCTATGALVPGVSVGSAGGDGGGPGGGTAFVTVGTPAIVIVDLSNLTDVEFSVPYRLTEITADGVPENRLLRLNGADPGIPLLGKVFLPASSQVALPVVAEFTDHDAIEVHEVQLSVDPDGDGTFEPLAVWPLRSVPVSGTTVAAPPVAPRGPLSLTLSRNPSSGPVVLQLRAAPEGTAVVRILDIAGRAIRRLDAQSAGGVLELAWDGRDAAGRNVQTGVYFVRAELAGVRASATIVRVE